MMIQTGARPPESPPEARIAHAAEESAAARVERALALADTAEAAAIFTERRDDDSRAEAAAIDRLRAAGGAAIFGGAPVTIKDNIAIAGMVSRAGTPALDDAPAATRDAAVVARLRRAGFVVLGHANMTELAFSGLGINAHFGTPLNPAFPGEVRIPGGSSSGAAASVGLGIAPAAIGTDTGGSIRIPAALCGLVGFKPTAAAVSRDGVVPLSDTLDSVGVIARSVGDCADIFQTIRDHPAETARDGPMRFEGLRLGLLEDYVMSDIAPEVAAVYRRALDRLSDLGVDVQPCPFPELTQLPEINRAGSFAGAESFFHFAGLLGAAADRLDPRVRVRIEAGRGISAAQYLALQANRRRMIAVAQSRWRDVDAIVMPTVPMAAPRLADLDDPDAYHRTNLLILRNPSVVNFIDGCAISLPCHRAGEAPVGLSLARSGGQDDALLRVARAVEAALSVGPGGS